MYENNELRNEIIGIFNGLSGGSSLDFVREDMGLEAGDLLLLEDGFSSKDAAILDSEVTPEIRNILEKALFAQAFKDLTEWEAARAQYCNHADYEKQLNELVEIQERMAFGMKFIEARTAEKNAARAELNSWCERYNNWKNSALYAKYQKKNDAANIFFAGLNTRKANYQRFKTLVSASWDRWHQLNKECKKYSDLWGQYFSLVNYEPGDYFITGDTEDVDDYVLLANNSYELMELLEETHTAEMRQYDAPESHGIGFWNFRNERKTEYQATKKQKFVDYRVDEEAAFWQSIELSKTVEQLNFAYIEE